MKLFKRFLCALLGIFLHLSAYAEWNQVPGKLARDISVGKNGAIYMIDTTTVGGGGLIYKWNGSTWQEIGGSAVRIDVDDLGRPWVVNDGGAVFRRNVQDTGWDYLPGIEARDIGVGADGVAYVIGKAAVPGGGLIYKWTGNGWQEIGGSAVRIDIDNRGLPWVVNENGAIFRRNDANTNWDYMPGVAANDIGSGADGSVFVTGKNPVAGGGLIYRWTDNTWQEIGGAASQISVDGQGRPFVVNSAGTIFFSAVSASTPFMKNILRNGHPETGNMDGWTITENGGNGWSVINGPTVEDNAFATSWGWAKRTQTVDLIQQGYSAALLDAQPPIYFAEMFEKTFCPDQYFLNVELLGAAGNVIHSWSSGIRTHKGGACDYTPYAEHLEHTLTHYGRGVRYIRWSDGGRDSEYWGGHYGAKLRFAYLTLHPLNLLKNPEQAGSWNILENGGNGFQVTGPAHEVEFRTSYGWARREQTIDLLASGYSPTLLATAPPIYFSSRFGMVGCPDKFFLDVELLDANRQIVTAWHSGELQHATECNWSQPYSEIVAHVIKDYGPNVRYIRWRDGGRDTEYWEGHYGTILADPYIGILSAPAQQFHFANRSVSFGGFFRAISVIGTVGVCASTFFDFGLSAGACYAASVGTAGVWAATYQTTFDAPANDTSVVHPLPQKETFKYRAGNRIISSYETGIDILDVWGEGRVAYGTSKSGFANAYNINCYPNPAETSDWCTGKVSASGAANFGQPIHKLVAVTNYANPVFPVHDNFVKTIVSMNSPLNDATIREMYRVLKKNGGRVVLYGVDASTQIRLLQLMPGLRRTGGAEVLEPALRDISYSPIDVYQF